MNSKNTSTRVEYPQQNNASTVQDFQSQKENQKESQKEDIEKALNEQEMYEHTGNNAHSKRTEPLQTQNKESQVVDSDEQGDILNKTEKGENIKKVDPSKQQSPQDKSPQDQRNAEYSNNEPNNESTHRGTTTANRRA